MGKIERNNRIHNNSTKISSKNKTEKKYNITLKSGWKERSKNKMEKQAAQIFGFLHHKKQKCLWFIDTLEQ